VKEFQLSQPQRRGLRLSFRQVIVELLHESFGRSVSNAPERRYGGSSAGCEKRGLKAARTPCSIRPALARIAGRDGHKIHTGQVEIISLLSEQVVEGSAAFCGCQHNPRAGWVVCVGNGVSAEQDKRNSSTAALEQVFLASVNRQVNLGASAYDSADGKGLVSGLGKAQLTVIWWKDARGCG